MTGSVTSEMNGWGNSVEIADLISDALGISKGI